MALSPMVRGYLECALWSSTDEDDEPLDAVFGIDDFSDDAIATAIDDCACFYDTNPADCDAYGDPAQVGHDLWLTRNRHGAGFWDRGPQALRAVGGRLTDAAHGMGSCDAYVGDDGMVYFA